MMDYLQIYVPASDLHTVVKEMKLSESSISSIKILTVSLALSFSLFLSQSAD